MPATSRGIIVWAVVGIVAAGTLLWAFPRAFPFAPRHWDLSRSEAVRLAQERLEALGPPVDGAYVVAGITTDELLERRLLITRNLGAGDRLKQSEIADRVVRWRVTIYEPGAATREWTYRVLLTTAGEVTDLQLRVPPDRSAPALDRATSRSRADDFLLAQGFDPGRYGQPEIRTRQLQSRSDMTLRYRDGANLLGPDVPYGLEVTFAGDRLAGFSSWLDDPEQAELQASYQWQQLAQTGRIVLPFLLLPVVGFFFVRRYHAGEVGVHRGLQLFVTVLAAGTVTILLSAAGATEGFSFGPISRRQTTWVWVLQMVAIYFVGLSLLTMLGWSVGESYCRERWGHKLASLDALLQRRWHNATVARSSLIGVSAGLAIAAGFVASAPALGRLGGWTHVGLLLGPWWDDARLPALAMVACWLAFSLYTEIFCRLFVVPPLVRRFGPWGGGAIAVLIGSLVAFPFFVAMPFSIEVVCWLVSSAAMVVLFLRYDLLATLLASFTVNVSLSAVTLLFAADGLIRGQAMLAVAIPFVPLLLSGRYLTSDEELEYHWDDVPPHVRRITDRERQRVELETARRIQGSILPDLPESLLGIELSHAYRPATEVGGDFYDVLALEDGRLAVALGDVAGHGVSSGLVMSRIHAALTVQVTFDPEVDSVFRTLNRLVFQSARKRLLATLVYLVVDPVEMEAQYASAGHLFPYLLGADGTLKVLESVAYPLGVRRELTVHPAVVRLRSGDTLFLVSDGIVEARPQGSDDAFGFERLEESLRRYTGEPPDRVRDGILDDVASFMGRTPQEDDMTMVVLRFP